MEDVIYINNAVFSDLDQCRLGQLLERIQISPVLFVLVKLSSDEKGSDKMTQHVKPLILPF